MAWNWATNLPTAMRNMRDLAEKARNMNFTTAPASTTTSNPLAPSKTGYTSALEQKTNAEALLGGAPKLEDYSQYGSASAKTQVDPQYYTNKWNTAAEDIQKEYSKRGGFYDRMMGSLNERGLANSGEYNAQTRMMGEDLATQLAKARQGIETEAMNTQAGYDENYANRMANLLGTQAGYDWSRTSAMPGIASGISSERNALVSDIYNQQQNQYNQQYQDLLDQLNDYIGIAGQVDFDEVQENPLTRLIANNSGFNMPELVSGEADLGNGYPWRYTNSTIPYIQAPTSTAKQLALAKNYGLQY